MHGKHGELLSTEKPPADTPFTTIYVTQPNILKQKKDVIVVIQEQTQDKGIWAYRLLMRLPDGGVEVGSAVGLVKKLQKLPFDGVPDKLDAPAKNSFDSGATKVEDASSTPGVIILNPGQLLYSSIFHECMSLKTWQARPKDLAFGPPYKINEVSDYSSHVVDTILTSRRSTILSRVTGTS